MSETEKVKVSEFPKYTELKSQDSVISIYPQNNEPQNSIVDLRALMNKPNNFQGGKIGNWISNWEILTRENWVLETVLGNKIDFDDNIENISRLPQMLFSKIERHNVDVEIEKLLSQNIVVECKHCQGEFISPIFLRPKKDGSFRLILNLKNLNKSVVYNHFKMETLRTAVHLVTQNCYFASCDLSQAYYACPIHIDHQKYLKFVWKGKLYKFVCFVNGLAEAPRKFSKMMKVPFAYLKKLGHANVAYIDDSLLISQDYDECCRNICDTVDTLDNLGFTIHPKKSILYPSQSITFLGFEIDSQKMSVQLTTEKLESTIKMCEKLMKEVNCTIRELAQMVGKLVSSEPGAPLAPLFYKPLEKEKTRFLDENKGNYDAKILINDWIKQHLKWWSLNLPGMYSEIHPKYPEIIIRTDSSDFAWGGIILNSDMKTNGMWSEEERIEHINYKELKAIFLCLQTFVKNENSKHVRIETDNTCACAYVNNMGGKIDMLDELARNIWYWAIERNLWISTTYIPGSENQIADTESRKVANHNIEWKLSKNMFQKIQKMWPASIDLFASRINKQLKKYVSWKQDPQAIAVDAFSLIWNANDYYIFPPFSLVARILAKLARDGGSLTLVVPVWPTQHWWVHLLEMTIAPPKFLGGKKLVTLPWDGSEHPLRSQLHLAVFRVSGQNCEQKDFRNELPNWLRKPGDPVLRSNTGRISKNGAVFVCRGKRIAITHL